MGASFSSVVSEYTQVYQTTKVVELHDSRLACVYWTLFSLIILFVVGYEILYCNDHFDKRDVFGTPSLTIQQPTWNGCNPQKDGCKSDFNSLTVLPYCSEYTGTEAPSLAEHRLPCQFADKHTVVPISGVYGSMMVPAKIEHIEEVRTCKPEVANNFTCDNEFERHNTSGDHYIADINRFTVLVSHTYHRDSLSGNNNQLTGHYALCNRVEPPGLIPYLLRAVYGAKECPGGVRKVPILCKTRGCGEGGSKDSLQQLKSQERRLKRLRTSVILAAGDTAEGVPEHPEENSRASGARKSSAWEPFAIADGDVFSVDRLLSLAGVSLDNTTNLDGETLRESGVCWTLR